MSVFKLVMPKCLRESMMCSIKTLAPTASFPYLAISELTRRLPYALNRELLFVHIRNLILLKVGGIREDLKAVLGLEPLWAFLFSGGKIMPSNQNGVKSCSKATISPLDLRDIISEDNYALRAFGTLLSTAKLSDFDSDNYIPGSEGKIEAEGLQYGLAKLIELYLAKQEQVLDNFAEEYRESDEYILQRTSRLIKLTEEGMWTSGCIAAESFFNALDGLETIIGRNPTLKPMAEEMKSSLMKYAPPEAAKNSKQEGVQ